MKLSNRIAALVLMFVPLVASAQYRDLDAAMSSLTRGFGNGDASSIVAGIGDEDQVKLEFPGLVEQTGFFGKDQAALLLDGLFNRVKPAGFDQTNTKKVSSEGQYHITALWTVKTAGKTEARDLYITLRNKNDRWSVVSIRSASK